MIERIHFENFKAWRTLDLRLEPGVTLLVGRNASGKTSVLEGIDALARLADERVTSPAFLRWWNRKARETKQPEAEGSRLGIEVTFGDGWGASFSSDKRPQDERDKPQYSLGTQRPKSDGRVALAADAHPTFESFAPDHAARLRRVGWFALDAGRLAAPSSARSLRRLGHDGAGLPTLLAHLKLRDEAAFAGIVKSLQEVVPQVVRVLIEPAELLERHVIRTSVGDQSFDVPETRSSPAYSLAFEMQGVGALPASDVGEGTLLALAVLALVLDPSDPLDLLMLDDLDLRLHPAAQESFVRSLTATLERIAQNGQPKGRGRVQVLATTHSPFVVNSLAPEAVRLVALGAGGARCGRLTDHPEFDRFKEVLQTGELWSTFGEQWLLDRQPKDSAQ